MKGGVQARVPSAPVVGWTNTDMSNSDSQLTADTVAALSSDLHLRGYVSFHTHTTASVTEVSLLPVLVCGTPCHHICGRTRIIDISKEH